MLTLTEVASAIVKAESVVSNAVTAVGLAVSATAAVVADVKKLVTYIPTLMQTFESAYAAVGQPDNGAGKLAGVLAALEATASKLAADWNDSVKAVISNIIAQAKAAFNAVAGIGATPVVSNVAA